MGFLRESGKGVAPSGVIVQLEAAPLLSGAEIAEMRRESVTKGHPAPGETVSADEHAVRW